MFLPSTFRLLAVVMTTGLLVGSSIAVPTQSLDIDSLGISLTRRADLNLTGYLGAFFLGADPYVYFYLSNGNSPTSFKALNRGSPVMRPTKGTGGVRDPSLIEGGGPEAGKKWYIIGTDLNIGRVSQSLLDAKLSYRSCLLP
jgi:hypothetical protein